MIHTRILFLQSEVKDAFMVVDTLAVSYEEKHSELITKIQENEDMVVKMAQLEVSLNFMLSQFLGIIGLWVRISVFIKLSKSEH